jgi:DNA invertase Pin-like site-specific DNA recombinase
VSTDEQKRKGYSLPEQEDRLLKYCDYNDIEVKGIFREDFSAKNFNRPEWKKLIAMIRKNPSNEDNILFVKWDRFSRNVAHAYEMLGILQKYNTTAMAIDQPIDSSIPESTVMFAIYLSVPEAENSRRALNTANGMRRAKLLGRYPNKAPTGFINLTALDGKKYITPKEPEAGIIKWVFQQLAKNSYKIEEVRRMAYDRGLKCSRSYFWKLIRNPVYCGLIPLSSNSEEQQMIKGTHEPLISEELFYEVQNIITTKRKNTSKTDELKTTFFLKGYLTCPVCNRKLRGSFSRGSSKRYPYYHCSKGCKTRINAGLVNNSYDNKLQHLILSKKAIELFSLILEDTNVSTQKVEFLQERKILLKQLEEQESVLSKARKLFVADKLKFDDFSELKKECQTLAGSLKKELDVNTRKLRCINQQCKLADRSFVDIFNGYLDLDIVDKKQVVNLIPPSNFDIRTGEVSVKLSNALSKIFLSKDDLTHLK